ncbi:MAG: helix-turn-helix domain-containing protein [Acetatifactor sp.]
MRDTEEFQVIERIKELCVLRGWTYYRLAKESGIPYSTLNTMLHKTNIPSVPTLEKLCAGLGITLAQFFCLEDDGAKLTEDQRQCLRLWDTLSDRSKALVLAYMQGVSDLEHKDE